MIVYFPLIDVYLLYLLEDRMQGWFKEFCFPKQGTFIASYQTVRGWDRPTKRTTGSVLNLLSLQTAGRNHLGGLAAAMILGEDQPHRMRKVICEQR